MTQLAINGGRPIIKQPLPADSTINKDDFEAVKRVFERGSLSGFYGSWGEEFLGGVEVKQFERLWAERFEVPYVVSVNSATSGLYAAVGALGISPGDEVIVPPYTMSATAMAPLVYGAIPVFADIDPHTFCLDPDAVRAAITPKTKAIIAVNLFGHPAPLTQLAAIAKEFGLGLIEDNAQGPLAMEDGRYAGTVADIGVFSLNYHKHIHTGEGGMCTTRDPELALRLQAIRNHAENIVAPAPIQNPVNMIGFNYRMTEMSAAVGISQLAKIDAEVGRRQHLAECLSEGLADLEGITVPTVRPGCRHVYYTWAAKLDEARLGVSRKDFSAALTAEGFPHFVGYVTPLYMLPVFQKRIAFGREGWPFNLTNRQYHKGLCPVAERMHERELLGFETCAYRVDNQHIELLIEAVRKVHTYRHSIPVSEGALHA
ncbi:DegT/DnrJ/EryC1/StrS family aminotransferase [Legionella maioricensis]|uniref:DegT/DnrJ/EryC1/StrS family aminotransferase n=1 Tax=Legionella maioricensis TaxID=2896528 RepID=A0A9X2I9W5_9GAMM|nr:DegT/DnrJ/EryC1/StrS family aminotransferase [Legionella maioricensis]MCL9683569.1 DegT/DnrJ/EryC1/StrS family aminotransferase [Legionella maioricensis]MCL9686868.1 DegT/DnrJ/EryC1/StrS family aminotransferase [Legionella maioricensis]